MNTLMLAKNITRFAHFPTAVVVHREPPRGPNPGITKHQAFCAWESLPMQLHISRSEKSLCSYTQQTFQSWFLLISFQHSDCDWCHTKQSRQLDLSPLQLRLLPQALQDDHSITQHPPTLHSHGLSPHAPTPTPGEMTEGEEVWGNSLVTAAVPKFKCGFYCVLLEMIAQFCLFSGTQDTSSSTFPWRSDVLFVAQL